MDLCNSGLKKATVIKKIDENKYLFIFIKYKYLKKFTNSLVENF